MHQRRALVVGSKLPPLQGVDNDAAAMQQLLRDQGFEVETLIGEAASRRGILDGYQRLIDDVAPDGAAVFYYAGHGGYATNLRPRPGERARLQCIFPTDWSDTGEFNAILDVELSLLLERLTDKTHNATVILDCCHSSALMRGPHAPVASVPLIPRVYGASWARGVPEFLARHRIDSSELHVESNPYAVRVVATAADRSAFETSVPDGGTEVYRGLFTATLEAVLSDPGSALLTWQTLITRVRELVAQCTGEQLPAVEGPADRMPFTTEVQKRPDAVAFFYTPLPDRQPYLRANAILGAVPGAEYDIMPLGVTEHRPSAAAAHARVVELVGPNARLELTLRAGRPETGALAFPTVLPYPPLRIRVLGATAARLEAELRAAAARGPRRVEVVRPPAPSRFTITADGTHLTMLDDGISAGTRLHDSDEGRALLIRRLERWSKAEALRTLTSSGLGAEAIRVAWGRVESNRQVPHASGEPLYIDDWIYVTVENCAARALHIAIFDIGLAGKVTLITTGSARGYLLEPRASYTLGRRDGEPIARGVGPMVWPDDVSDRLPRRESLIVIAARSPTDFARLETEFLPMPTRSAGATRATPLPLEAILDGFRAGSKRDMRGELSDEESFCVRRIDFDLFPHARTAAS